VIQGGETTPVMLVDRQVDPVKGTLLHADFKRHRTSPSACASASRAHHGRGGRRQGAGRVARGDHPRHRKSNASDEIPEGFTVDVTRVDDRQAKRASDVVLTGSMKAGERARDGHRAFRGAARRGVAEPTAAEAAAAAVNPRGRPQPRPSPRSSKKGKKEEEAPAEEKEKGKKK